MARTRLQLECRAEESWLVVGKVVGFVHEDLLHEEARLSHFHDYLCFLHLASAAAAGTEPVQATGRPVPALVTVCPLVRLGFLPGLESAE